MSKLEPVKVEPKADRLKQPESVKVEPWADFPKQPYSLFTDDFVHEKQGVLRINAKSDKSSASVKVSSISPYTPLQEELRLWWAISGGRTLYTKIKSSDYLKVHLDNGITQKWGVNWNLYGSVNANKSLTNVSIRLGAHCLTSKFNLDNRVKIDYATIVPDFTWYNRTLYTEGKITLGGLFAINLSRKVIAKNNIFLGYKLDDQSNFFLRAENYGYRKDSISWDNFFANPHHTFDNIKFNFVSSYKENIRYGLEAVLGTKGRIFRQALFVFQHEEKEKKVTSKVRLSSNFDVALAIKYPSILFPDQATTTLGVYGNNLLTAKDRSFTIGGQIEFNI